MDILERYVAIDNKCAWPNLTLMPDGSIVASVFGEPCHLLWEGEAECWRSQDGGRSWSFLSVPVPNEKGTARGNLAAGLTHGGALVVVCTGRSNMSPKGIMRSKQAPAQHLLAPFVSRSEDGGTTWTHESQVFAPATRKLLLFGDIERLPGGRLAVSCYSSTDDHDESGDSAWVSTSATTTGEPGAMPGLLATGTTKPTCWFWAKTRCLLHVARRERPKPRSLPRVTGGLMDVSRCGNAGAAHARPSPAAAG